ncbi:hypothetical protein HWV23_02835 [Natronomonas halophila]|uniref:hypothetical protein n=1 Tax=Natronomonas halophila TaxID=2747817 RepID=UPI0015B6CD7C|nr:hypothetical protein [Natronomonas halophila]QLD84638.1 hypothetical protein HWV23_02560 [Natronomonas halophila]QLD84692.1 hypothetical protein HWV23_02835 [Natronomonas halophila]
MSPASYDGPALDGTVQHLSEAPYWQGDGETVDVVDDRVDGAGEERTENVPVPDGGEKPDVDGQTTLEDWGWSA